MEDEESEDIIVTLDSNGLPEGATIGNPNSATITIADNDDTPPAGLPDVFMKFEASIQIEIDGEFVVLEAEGVPNHPSPYWEMGNSLFEENTDSEFEQNPHSIEVQDWVFRIPLNPGLDNDHQATPGGPIGISINGVPFFNQFAAMNSLLDDETLSFDQYNGHPQPDYPDF